MSKDKKQELDELYGYGLKIIQELQQSVAEKDKALEEALSRYDTFVVKLEQIVKKAKDE